MNQVYKPIHQILEEEVIHRECQRAMVIHDFWYRRTIKTHLNDHFDVKDIEGDIDVLAMYVKQNQVYLLKAWEMKPNDNYKKKAFSQLDKHVLFLKTQFENCDLQLFYKTPEIELLYKELRI